MKIRTVRLVIFRNTFEKVLLPQPVFTKANAFPTANRKEGKTKSVGVNPCQLACSNGPKVKLQSPEVFTIIIKQMVIPRKTSSALNLFIMYSISFVSIYCFK